MAEKLTPQQSRAVHHRGGNLLVSAAAGSGKTKVLVDRLLEYLTQEDDPANLDDFLMITYTNAAASELREKIADKLTARIALEPQNRRLQQQLQRLYLAKISTVHGFCGDVLRQYAYRLDIPADFRVADEEESRELREQVLQDMLEAAYAQGSEDFRFFVDTQGYGRDDRRLPELIGSVYDAARCHLNPNGWLDKCLESAQVQDITDPLETLWGQWLLTDFRRTCRRHREGIAWCIQSLRDYPKIEKVIDGLTLIHSRLQELEGAGSWDAIRSLSNMEYARMVFPKTVDDESLKSRVKLVRDSCKKQMDTALKVFADDAEQTIADIAQTARAQQGLISLVRRFEKDYRAKKRAARILDFSDLEHKMLDLLYGSDRSAPTAAAREIAARFREVMVDEYQDSNQVQDAVFAALTAQSRNLFLVGDVKQSIYRFRLADPGIFLDKYRTYSDDGNAEGSRVLLSHNFRSGPEIVEAVNDVFTTCMSESLGGLAYTEAEALREGVPHEKLPEPAVEFACLEAGGDSYGVESRFAAARIAEMLQNGTLIRDGESLRPVRPEDIVILLRSPNSVGGHYLRALQNLGIPCNTGAGENLLETREIATFQALLQVISNPRQDIPLVSLLASPVFGFTAEDLARIRGRRRKGNLYECLLLSDSEKAQAFLETLETLRRKRRTQNLTELLGSCLTLTRLDSIFAAGNPQGSRNVQQFFKLVTAFETGGTKTLEQLLEHLEARREKGVASETPAGGVTIMSIHKSKGLEFPVVFLCATAHQFNLSDSRAGILCDSDLGLGLYVTDTHQRVRYPSLARRAIAAKLKRESVSEEMRVLYVALTRPKDRLIMTYTEKNMAGVIEKTASSIAALGGRTALEGADCFGTWLLTAALQRTEAGALRNVCGTVPDGHLGEYLWKITLQETAAEAAAMEAEAPGKVQLPEGALEQLRQGLSFRYGHTPATMAPSKQTATGRKDHFLDEEAASLTRGRGHTEHRIPSFAGSCADGRAYGTAMHLCMQHIDYTHCGSREAVEAEISRLTREGFLKPEQQTMVNGNHVAAFFASPLGQKLAAGCACLREFKFSILDDAAKYGEGLEGEQVLLQGVVDCALIEPEGITILDFKTDYVTEETLPSLVQRYSGQIRTYCEALQRIYRRPILGSFLYFFRLNRFASVEIVL